MNNKENYNWVLDHTLKKQMEKIDKVIKSCETFNHLNSAHNLVTNFKRMYESWSKKRKKENVEIYCKALYYAQQQTVKINNLAADSCFHNV